MLDEYKLRRLPGGFSPFQLMFKVPPHIIHAEGTSMLVDSAVDHRANSLMICCARRANLVMEKLVSHKRSEVERSFAFQVGDWVLFAQGQSLDSTVKWPEIVSKYYGSCRIIRARHTRYILESTHGP